MKKGITLMDGAVGTSLWDKAEARGIKKDPVWRYNIEHPEIVAELAAEMADAGAEIVLANTFGANGPAVKRSSSYTAPEVVSAGVRILKEAVKGRGVKTCLAAGPLSAQANAEHMRILKASNTATRFFIVSPPVNLMDIVYMKVYDLSTDTAYIFRFFGRMNPAIWSQ